MNNNTVYAIVTIGSFFLIGFIYWLQLGDNNSCDDCDSCQKIELIDEN